NEEEDDTSNNNQPPLGDNANARNLVVDNNNAANNNVANANANVPNPLENKKARLEAKLTNGIKQISPPNFDDTTLGDGDNNWLIEMENKFAIRNFLEETKVVCGAYQFSHEASS
ncbi:hypothetical protein KI387_024441, partial [Taxus chinensis]